MLGLVPWPWSWSLTLLACLGALEQDPWMALHQTRAIIAFIKYSNPWHTASKKESEISNNLESSNHPPWHAQTVLLEAQLRSEVWVICILDRPELHWPFFPLQNTYVAAENGSHMYLLLLASAFTNPGSRLCASPVPTVAFAAWITPSSPTFCRSSPLLS